MALTTPPLKRPYSAEMPEVSTCVSSIASSMNRFCGMREQVVVHVDAVDHEDVVEREGAVDDQLAAFGEFSLTPRRQLRDALNRPRRGEQPRSPRV